MFAQLCLLKQNCKVNDSTLLKNSEGNCHGEWNFCQGKEPEIALFLQVG